MLLLHANIIQQKKTLLNSAFSKDAATLKIDSTLFLHFKNNCLYFLVLFICFGSCKSLDYFLFCFLIHPFN